MALELMVSPRQGTAAVRRTCLPIIETPAFGRAGLLSGAAACALLFGSVPASAQAVHVTEGNTYVADETTTIGPLTIDPGATVDLQPENGANMNLTVDDGGVDTTWAGTIVGVNGSGGQPTTAIIKSGAGKLTFSNLTANSGAVHLADGTTQLTAGESSFRYLAVGSGTGADAIFNITGGNLQIGETPVPSPSPALQVGDWGGVGVVNQSGGTVSIQASFNLGNQGGTGTYNLSGGSVYLSDALYSIGRSTSSSTKSTGTLNVSGGLFEIGNGNFVIGSRDSGGAGSGSTGTITQTGGTIRVSGNGSDGSLFLSGYTDGFYNLYGGTLEVGGSALAKNYGGSGVATFNLGGGTIRVINQNLTTSVDATLVDSTVSTINTNGYDATWSGVLSGSGNIAKAGEGKLTFTSKQLYTGATTVSAGKLSLTGNGDIAASSGVDLAASGAEFEVGVNGSRQIGKLSGVAGTTLTVGDNATLSFGTAADTRFDGQILGAGTIRKVGSGNLTLGREVGASSKFYIDEGVVTLEASNAFVNATLLSLATGATLDLGGNGVQTFSHSAQLQGTLRFHLDGGDTIVAESDLDISGSTLDLRGGTGGFDATQPYVIATAAGSFTADDVSVVHDLYFLDPIFSALGSEGRITFERNDATLASLADTKNGAAVGAALDALPPSNPVVAGLTTLGEEAGKAVLTALSGEVHASLGSGIIESAQNVSGAIGNRVADVFRSGGPASVPLGYAADARLDAFAAPPQSAGIWGSVHGSTTSLAGTASTLDGTGAGLVAGIDYRADGWLAGFGGGYGRSAYASGGISSADVDSAVLLGYFGNDMGAVRLHGGAAVGWNTIATTRTVALPVEEQLSASYGARTAQVFGEVSAPLGPFRPFAGATFMNVATDAFVESGGDAALASAAGSRNVALGTLGLRASQEFGVATASAMVGWRYGFGDIAGAADLAIQGSGFTAAGVGVAGSALLMQAGLEIPVGPRARLGLSYEGMVAADSQHHTARASANITF